MKKEKDFYTSPEVETLELRIEGIICQSITGKDIESGELENWGIL